MGRKRVMGQYMGDPSPLRNKRGNIRHAPLALVDTNRPEEEGMHDREKISTGPNAEAIDENIGGTAPGIPDDALAPGEEELPQPPTDEQVEEAARKLKAPTERDTLPLEGE